MKFPTSIHSRFVLRIRIKCKYALDVAPVNKPPSDHFVGLPFKDLLNLSHLICITLLSHIHIYLTFIKYYFIIDHT